MPRRRRLLAADNFPLRRDEHFCPRSPRAPRARGNGEPMTKERLTRHGRARRMFTDGGQKIVELDRGDVTEAGLNSNEYGGCGHGREWVDNAVHPRAPEIVTRFSSHALALAVAAPSPGKFGRASMRGPEAGTPFMETVLPEGFADQARACPCSALSIRLALHFDRRSGFATDIRATFCPNNFP